MFTLFLLMFICFGSFGGYVHNENIIDDHINQNQNVKEAVDYNGERYLFTCSDIINSYTFKAYVDYAPMILNLNTNQSVTINVYETPSASFGLFSSVDWDLLRINNPTQYFNGLTFTCNGRDVANGFIHYTLYVTNTVSSQSSLISSFTYVMPPTDYPGLSGYSINVHNSINFTYCVTLNRYDNPILYDWFVNGSGISNYISGYNNGYNVGYTEGNTLGYQNGYNTAINELDDTSSTAVTIFTGILDIALLPVNVFLTILNFEVFGINISGFVTSLLTITIVIIIVRFLLGGKDDK